MNKKEAIIRGAMKFIRRLLFKILGAGKKLGTGQYDGKIMIYYQRGVWNEDDKYWLGEK